MRDRDVYGKKINHVSFVLLLAILFLLMIGARVGMLAILEGQLAELGREQAALQERIDAILLETESRSYHDVEDIIDELPSGFDQIGISDDLSIALGLSGITASAYSESILDDADLPFSANLPDTLRAVKVTISMTVSDASLMPAYLQWISDSGRIFHVDAVAVDYLESGALVSLTVYTFYNDVDL